MKNVLKKIYFMVHYSALFSLSIKWVFKIIESFMKNDKYIFLVNYVHRKNDLYDKHIPDLNINKIVILLNEW